ncbi:hypothetical protein RPB_4498 [Rhodopseudomonas palustris HaA2]|uniref:LysR family transcriptional regulator n=1 Tax=Rhodopseudomonas palustris (strain HaA2) TaxID=316058 RepID=Q2IRH9_RHOP2|nr:hypothetical protein RPB_4498 [Rhodopseudomonas palustris HaA2]
MRDERNAELFKITLEQLRLLYVLGSAGSISQVTKQLQPKHQSSVVKSLESLRNHTSTILKSELFDRKAGRGRNPLTPAGRAAFELAESSLLALKEFTEKVTSDGRFVVHVGLTTFLLNLVKGLVPRLHSERQSFESRLVHLRTGKLEESVLKREVDCAFGGRTVKIGESSVQEVGLKVRTIREDTFGFMLNYTTNNDQLTIKDIFAERIPLILPTSGVVFDFVRENLGVSSVAEIQQQINVVEWCDDVHFAFEIMRLRLHDAGMFVLKGVYDGHFQRFYDSANGDAPLTRYFSLADVQHKSMVTFMTNEEFVASLSKEHPVRQCIAVIDSWLDNVQLDAVQ